MISVHMMMKAFANYLRSPEPVKAFNKTAALLPHWTYFLKGILVAIATLILIPYVITIFYLVFNPPLSAIMFYDVAQGRPATHIWRNLDRVSPQLIKQVILSEDSRFCQHHGVDWSAIDIAFDAAQDGHARGASTLSMQTAKNLFLWSKPALPRKILELPLAYFMDTILGKRRMIELYLNFAEWGPGLYGAEAAARHYFDKSAALLDSQDSAQLAASLPNPKKRDAGNPSLTTSMIADHLLMRLAREHVAMSCITRKSKSIDAAISF